MIQLATQLAATLSWWGKGQVGHWYLLASVGLKALVVGVVSMHRLDDKRLVRSSELCKSFVEPAKPAGLCGCLRSRLLAVMPSALSACRQCFFGD